MKTTACLLFALTGLVATACAGQPDLASFVHLTSPIPNWPKDGAGLAKGFWVEELSGGGPELEGVNPHETRWAIVGETDSAFQVETTAFSSSNGVICALTVQKADGKILSAGVGVRGQKPVPITWTNASDTAAEPEGTDEEVTVKAGTFHAKKTEWTERGGTYTEWTGTSGDTAGIFLKSTSSSGESSELNALEKGTCSIGDKEFKVFRATYSDGSESAWIHERIPFFGSEKGTCVNASDPDREGAFSRITGMGQDARPELDWSK